MSRLKETDDFGARMKGYEAVETKRRLDVSLPIYARIDGRAFSRFTQGMEKPFDARLTAAMQETARYLVQQTHARMGFTQSDEISLVWQADGEASDIFFSGKIQKMVSVLASMAAAKFATICPDGFEDKIPHFDCRVFQLPNRMEAANAFLWRAMDAKKNGITMIAQSMFSARQLYGKGQTDMVRMIREAGASVVDFPVAARRGSFMQRRVVLKRLSPEELDAIPEAHRPTGPVRRTEVQIIEMPEFNNVANRVEVIFAAAEPIFARSIAA